MASLDLTKEEYKELIELVFLGVSIKTGDIIPESYEQLTNFPSVKLRNKVFSQAKVFDCEHLIHHEENLKGQYFLKEGDNLWFEYLDE